MRIIKRIFSSRLVQNSIWLMILQVFNAAVPLITLPYITRVLEPDGYGSFSLALNWILYFQVLVEYGFGFLGARKIATYVEDRLQEIYGIIITARIILLAISFVAMNIVFVLSGMSITHYVCMLLLFLMVIGTSFQLTWLFQGKQDMQFITIVNAAARALSVILVFLFVSDKTHLYRYCFLYSCTYLFSSAIGLFVAYKKYGMKLKLAPFSKAIDAIKEGGPLFLSQAMSKVLSGFGVTVLGAVASSSVVGIYSAVYKIPSVMTQFFSPISQSLYPSMSVEFTKSDAQGLAKVKKITVVVVAAFALLAGILIVLRSWIVMLVFGEEYVAYSDIIIPLCLWLILGITNNFLGIQTLVASGHQKEYSKAFTIGAAFSVLLNIVLGKMWSLYGVAWAAFFSEFVLTVALIYNIKRIFYNRTHRGCSC